MISNFPILAVMTLFMGAFLNSLGGHKNRVIGNIIVFIAMAISFCLVFAMIPAVFYDGGVIKSWMGGWEPAGGWAYGIGIEVDGLSLFFGIVVIIAVMVSGVYSFTYMARDDAQNNFYTLFLMLSGSVLGLVFSGDLFNVYVMVEIMTFSAVALTAFRNLYEGALEGAFKYLVVGSIGSTCVLVGTILIYANLHTLNMAQIAQLMPSELNPVLVMAFGFLFAGFCTKAFLFPFQPLAADAHAVAPASISLMISGVLTKCGVYGIIRISYDLFKNIEIPQVQILITGFGCVTMFICVTMAFNQHNFKRLLAFHSISQVGYVITAVGLGTALGLSAGLFHAINHTIFKGLLFLVAGAVQHETGTLDLDRLGGLSKRMPKTTALFLIGAASISGIPPFNGFSSKWMIYQAAFAKAGETGNFFYVVVCVAALITSVLTLASFIKVAQSVFFGQLPKKYADTKECPLTMRIPMWILAALCLLVVLDKTFLEDIVRGAAGAAMNPAAYIDQMFGGSMVSVPAVLSFIGNWNPVMWLILLIFVIAALTIVSVSTNERKPEPLTGTDVEDECVLPENAKYEPFFSGEESHYSQVGGGDLFWGFKENWKKYFAFWSDWHSGIVNDYALYAVVSLVFILSYCLILL